MEARFFVFLVAIWAPAGAIFYSSENLHYAVSPVAFPVEHLDFPTWDARKNVLYYANVYEGDILRYEYDGNIVLHKYLQGTVTFVIPSKKDSNLLIVGLNRSIVAIEWINYNSNNNPIRLLTTVSDRDPTSRINGGKADKQGRLLIGTMGNKTSSGSLTPNQGALYEVTCETLNSPSVLIAPVNMSNGATWNKANDKFYYIDTPSRQIVEYAYDNDSGELSNRRVVFNMDDHKTFITGELYGMTIDDNDDLWVALFGGGAVIRVKTKTSQITNIIGIPAEYVTSVMWGGPAFDILYVTTSRYLLTREQRKKQPVAGALFAVTGLGRKGIPVFNVDLLESFNDKKCGAKKST